MSVKVTSIDSSSVTLDNGDKWSVDVEQSLYIYKTKSGQPDELIATFASNRWDSVRSVAKDDRAALLAAAVELISDVDGGNFGHQSTMWQNKAEQFLADAED